MLLLLWLSHTRPAALSGKLSVSAPPRQGKIWLIPGISGPLKSFLSGMEFPACPVDVKHTPGQQHPHLLQNNPNQFETNM